MVKQLNGWEVSKQIINCKVYLLNFPGEKAQCIDHYKKPSMRDIPDHFIVYVGTNDLNSKVSSKSITETIVDFAMSLKSESNNVRVSSVVLRTDNPFFNEKRYEVNSDTKDLCEE